MSSTTIYSSELSALIEQSITRDRRDFQPTYLYIKQHSVTGKLYFGKTSKSHDEMLKYLGSGKRWQWHIKKHGIEHVETLWYCLFYDQEDCTNFALIFSSQENIVESTDWLNLKPENGLDGNPINTKMTSQQKQKLSILAKERHKNPTQNMIDGRIKTSKTNSGRVLLNNRGILHWAFGKKGENHPNFGKVRTAKQNAQRSNNIKGENHPNFGKFGPDHPCFGKSWSWSDEAKKENSGVNNPKYGIQLSDDHRLKISNSKKGENNPNFGKSMSLKQKEQISKSREDKVSAYDLENNIFVCVTKEIFNSLKGIRYVGTTSKLIPRPTPLQGLTVSSML